VITEFSAGFKNPKNFRNSASSLLANIFLPTN